VRRRFERRILAQDEGLQPPRLASRLDPELADQRAAEILVAARRIHLAARPVQRQHALFPQALTQRVPGGEHLQLAHQLATAAAGQLRLHAQFQGFEPYLLQPGRLRASQRHVGQASQGRPAPPGQRLAEMVSGTRRVACRQRVPPPGQQRLETARVHLDPLGSQQVARRPCDQPLILAASPQRAAQLRHPHLQVGGGPPGRLIRPQLILQDVRGDDGARVDDQHGQHCLSLRAADGDGLPVHMDFGVAKDLELDPALQEPECTSALSAGPARR
jgi:hypothetical protein